MKNIFISRHQDPDSVFLKTLSSKGYSVTGMQLIDISAVPFGHFPEVDWIFFYSKNGVKYFFEQLRSPLSPVPKIGAIGPGTADYIEEHFAHPNFVGDGNVQRTAHRFSEKAKEKKVLFPRAQNSQRSVQKWLGPEVAAIDLVVYKNEPIKGFDLPDFDCLVFTSPLNATAYFSEKEYQEGQQIIAIGNTTAQALKEIGIKSVTVADKPTETSLAAAVLDAITPK